VFQGITVVAAEVPAGVLADTISRRLSLVVAHVVMGSGMAMAGLVVSFPLLVVSQCLWGLGWAFSSGADVGWLTDELTRPASGLARPELVDRVLAAQARWELVGAPAGIAAFGMLAWATGLSTAIVASGLGMALLGVVVVARWPETGFAPAAAGRRWRQATSIFRRGVVLARTDRVVAALIVATVLVHGSHAGYGRLRERRLVGLGLPSRPDPIVWFAVLGLVAAVIGAAVLRIVEARIGDAGVARRTYLWSCAAGVAGLLLFALAPVLGGAVAGSLVLSGVVDPVIRATTTIWVNRRATSDVRATVHSFLSQAENAGEIVFGLALAAVAALASSTAALLGAVVLLALAGVMVHAVDGEA